MATREPFRYELTPRAVVEGKNWLTVTLENVGAETLKGLHVKLNSLDVYSVEVLTDGAFVPLLDPEAREVIPFRVSTRVSGSVYLSVDGDQNGESFHWESPDLTLTVGEEVAELVSVLTLAEPEPALGDVIRCEAAIRGRLQSDGLQLEFWAETPTGVFEELAIVETKALSPQEEARYVAEVEASEEGPYTIYAYLYDGTTRIGRKMETVRVGDAS